MQKMQESRDYMNKLTRRIRNKGYTLEEFCQKIGMSLRWYRTHEKEDSPKHLKLVQIIDDLEVKY